jgi:hypothetical protein
MENITDTHKKSRRDRDEIKSLQRIEAENVASDEQRD